MGTRIVENWHSTLVAVFITTLVFMGFQMISKTSPYAGHIIFVPPYASQYAQFSIANTGKCSVQGGKEIRSYDIGAMYGFLIPVGRINRASLRDAENRLEACLTQTQSIK